MQKPEGLSRGFRGVQGGVKGQRTGGGQGAHAGAQGAGDPGGPQKGPLGEKGGPSFFEHPR